MLPGQLLKSICFGLYSSGSLSVSLRSWGATSCAFFSLYLQICICSPAPHLQGCWFPWRVKSPVYGLHLHNSFLLLRNTTCSDTRGAQVCMCPFSSCCQKCKCTENITEEGPCCVCEGEHQAIHPWLDALDTVTKSSQHGVLPLQTPGERSSLDFR